VAEPLKYLVDASVVEDLAGRFGAADPGFDAATFVSEALGGLDDLQLKPRIEQLSRALRQALPVDYPAALDTVVLVATSEPLVEGWAAWPLASFIEIFGVDHPGESLAAMEHVTKRMSCEFAIRPFLRDHFDAAYAQLERFAVHDDESVRRLPSEGSRPRLPWGMKVQRLVDDPVPGLTLLERLRHDASETVRRSVANHLNDIAKDHPEIVVETTRRWIAEAETDRRMVTHALRTLMKRGDGGALDVLGFTTDAKVDIGGFGIVPGRVVMGDHIELWASIGSTSVARQRLVVDFVVHHIGARGKTSPKVFKWTTIELAAGERRELNKRRLIQHASTRTYYPGVHRVELQVAGAVVAETSFTVELSA